MPYLDSFPVIRTDDAEQMRAALIGSYGARSFDYPAGVEDFYGCGNHLQLPALGLSYCVYNTAVEVDFPAIAAVRQQFCLHAGGRTATGARIDEVRPGRSCVINAGADAKVSFAAGYEQVVVWFDQDLLARKLAALTGVVPSAALEFETALDLASAPGQALQNLIVMAATLFGATRLPPAASAELEQAVAAAMLSCNRHNFSRLLDAAPKDPGPWQVRRVEDYIEANWNAPLTVEALAQVAGCSARSIFKAFQTSRGYSPMAFVKKVRLDKARAMLLSAEPRASVIGIAFACGFGNPGHFARDYRETFGELPSATLNRGRAARG